MDDLIKLSKKLQSVLGDELVAVFCYQVSSNSVTNLLIVLKSMNDKNLTLMKPAIQETSINSSFGVITLTKEELKQSADVFPIKFRTIQKHGRVLCGENCLEFLEIKDSHLRLRCEQELRNLSLRLRQSYLKRNLSSAQKIEFLFNCSIKLKQDLFILAEIKEGSRDLSESEILEVLNTLNLSLDQISEIQDAYKNSLLDEDKIENLFHKFREYVDKATCLIDQL
jgi:hypothetical protein